MAKCIHNIDSHESILALIVVFMQKSHLHKQVFDKNPTNKMGNMDGQRGLNISLDPLTIKKNS